MVKKTKKPVKKMNGKKLEDRIAPGMVGGGLVDPGMAEMVDADIDQQSDQSVGEIEQTESDSYQAEDHSEGQYLDESVQAEAQPSAESYTESADEYKDEYSSDENYDEFAGPDVEGGEFVEDTPTWQEPDWVSANADGSININPPEGVTIEEGVANFTLEAANEELPLPEGMEIQQDGSIDVQLPEGTEYFQESNQILMPQGEVELNDIPEDMNAYTNAQGDIMITLPDDGFEYNAETNSLNVDNYHVNEMAPEFMEVNPDGSVAIDLPSEGVEYNDDGSIHMNAEAVNYMDNPPPEYYSDMDYAQYNGDGSMLIQPPEGIEVDGGVCTMDCELANEQLPLDENFSLNADGSSEYKLPEGTEYNSDINGLVFSEGAINLDEVPEGIDAHVNPDGTTTVMLADGMQFDGDSGTVHLDNYWTNEVTPDQMQITGEGEVNIALPEGTEYFEDGSFQIPADSIDFMEEPAPEYVYDVEWSEGHADGSYSFQPPEEFQVDAEQGVVEMPHDAFVEECPIDENIKFHPDGTMDVLLPEGTSYDAATNSFTMPAGESSIEEIPEQVNATLNADGSITVSLQDGMNYDAEMNSVHLDNYWTNELTPDPVEFHQDGSVEVKLPQGTEYNDDGSFTIPEHQADFLENPDAGYVAQGPEWVDVQPDGSVYVENFEHIDVDAEQGTLSMQTDYMAEQFEDYIPEDVHFHADGTMEVKVPEGTSYNAESNSLTFAQGQLHMNEIPSEMQAQLNSDGSITVNLQEGMHFNAEAETVHFDNYWTNVMTPEPVEFSAEGQVTIDLPHDTHYYDDGSFQIPEHSSDFIEDPCPDYVDHGPEWVSDNPDGSVTVQAPESMVLDPEQGTLSMSAEVAMQELGGDLIPEEITLNADGSANIKLPEGTSYDLESNSLTFAAGEVHIHEIPEGMEAHMNEDGSVTVSLHEGAIYESDTQSVKLSNEMINAMAPEPITITADGQFQFQIQLPEDTQYFEGNSFVISAESADFLDDGGHGEHHDGEHYDSQQYQQAG